MGKKSDIYKAYLAKWRREHPDIVKPVCYGGFSGRSKRFEELDLTGELTEMSGDFRTMLWCIKDRIVKTPDGRVVELGRDNQGIFPLGYEFPNEEAWRNYDEPMSYNVYWDHW